MGYVARPHGIRGELRVVTHAPESTTLAQVDQVYIDGRSFELAGVRPVQGAYLIHLAGMTNRDQAESMRGKTVSVDRELIALQEGEILLADLVGLDVVLVDGSPYGTVAAVHPGAQDLLVIHDGPVERLLPLVSEFVETVDLDSGQLVVDPPPDLPETHL